MAPPEAAPPATLPSLAVQLATRQGQVVALCLAALSALAWWWLWRGGLMGAAPDQTMVMDGMAMEGMMMPVPWSAGYIAAAFAMWAIMMVAMMLPSVAPMILLHAAFSKRNGLGTAATSAFAASYLAVWVLSSLVAALAQAALADAGLVGQMTLRLGTAPLAAGLLAAAGLYQLTPLKRRCLAACQAPVSFLMRHWRPGIGGGVAMGLRHGLYCLGCCWVLMALLFVGGVMNLAWVAVLALIVLGEKCLPPAWHADRWLAGALLLGAAAAVLS